MLDIGLAKAMSYMAGIVCSFMSNNRWTFRNEILIMSLDGRAKYAPIFLKFITVAVIFLIANTTVYVSLVNHSSFELYPLLMTTFITYALNYYWTYQSQ